MRILSRKIWRAFPELDQFDDDVCRRYIRQARKLGNSTKGAFFVMLVLPLSFVLWAGLMFNFDAIMYYLESWHNIEIFDFLSSSFRDVFIAIRLTGYIWFPVLCMAIVRDRWLNRCIRKQLSGNKCGACGYSLIGLSLMKDSEEPSVTCPECGHHIVLREMGLSKADIDPTLLAGSRSGI